MKKSITVIIKENSKSQDPRAKVKKVSRGYAFNYLIPKQIAEVATHGKIKHLNMLQKIASNNRDLTYRQSISIKSRLDSAHAVHVRKKCSQEQLIFGSISEQDIANNIHKLTGQRIDKKQIIIANNKKLGKYAARVIIDDGIESVLSLRIIPKKI